MIPFFVVGTVDVSHYEGKKSQNNDSRIVMANTELEAEDKYRKFWNDQTVEYSVYYSVYSCEAREPIM